MPVSFAALPSVQAMSIVFRAAATLLPLCLASLFTGCQPPESKAKAEVRPQEVHFVRPLRKSVEEYEEYTGRSWAANTVEIRTRVSGYLEKVNFKDGALVDEDDVLAEIDDQSFQAETARAAANKAQLEARLDKLEKQERRALQLLQGNTRAITQDEYETIVADKNEAAASIDAAIAANTIAELNLSYTRVQAPIRGRISRRLVDPGNLVTADSTILATIVTVDPIHVYFDMDERTVLRLKRLLRDGKIKSARESEVEVQIALADETEFAHRGVVNFIDNQLDPATGTLRFRAEVQNEDQFFTPGMFVRLRFPVGESQPALLVPEEALATDQGERQVFVINEQNEVEARRVKTGILVTVDEKELTDRTTAAKSDGVAAEPDDVATKSDKVVMRVITGGLAADDRVVVTGLQRIKKKTPVTPVDKSLPKLDDDPAKTASTP